MGRAAPRDQLDVVRSAFQHLCHAGLRDAAHAHRQVQFAHLAAWNSTDPCRRGHAPQYRLRGPVRFEGEVRRPVSASFGSARALYHDARPLAFMSSGAAQVAYTGLYDPLRTTSATSAKLT